MSRLLLRLAVAFITFTIGFVLSGFGWSAPAPTARPQAQTQEYRSYSYENTPHSDCPYQQRHRR